MQGYVSHLRKVLGEDVIVTRGHGYLLAVGTEQVDAGRFEALVADGRSALAAGDATAAAGSSARGWRCGVGEPLADFACEPFAQDEIARLGQARLAAVEDRIDAQLALGEHIRLVGELEALARRHPLRERVIGQLMVALYRSGRQADALSVYRQTSELLREELGLDPSRMLQELERSILEQDASLDGGVRNATAASGAALPGVCPFKGLAFFDRADAEYFFGRERLVSDVGRAAGGVDAGWDPRPVRDRQVFAFARRCAAGVERGGAAGQRRLAPAAAATGRASMCRAPACPRRRSSR